MEFFLQLVARAGFRGGEGTTVVGEKSPLVAAGMPLFLRLNDIFIFWQDLSRILEGLEILCVQARGEAAGGEAEQGADAPGCGPAQQYQLATCCTVSTIYYLNLYVTVSTVGTDIGVNFLFSPYLIFLVFFQGFLSNFDYVFNLTL